jgi:hypothetical protein
MAIPTPINPFEEKPAGYFPQQAPSAYAGFNSPPPLSPYISAPAPAAGAVPGAAQAQSTLGYLAPIASGFAAGSQAQPTTSAAGATMQAVGSGVTGAASGAALGTMIAPGPGTAIGAGIGGLVGLVSGGIQSFFGLKQARAQKRDFDRQIAEINRKEAERLAYEKELNAQARADTQESLRYNRKQAALSSQFNAFNSVLALLNNNQAQAQGNRNTFIEQGR